MGGLVAADWPVGAWTSGGAGGGWAACWFGGVGGAAAIIGGAGAGWAARARSEIISLVRMMRGVSSSTELGTSLPRSKERQAGVMRTELIRRSAGSGPARNGGGMSNSTVLRVAPFQGDHEALFTWVSSCVFRWIILAIFRQVRGWDRTALLNPKAIRGMPETSKIPHRQRWKPRRLPPIGASGSMAYFLGEVFPGGFVAAGVSLVAGALPSAKRTTRLLSSRRVPSVESSWAR